MHHIRVAVATQEHYQKSGRHLKNCRGPCESESSPYKSIYSQSTARSDMKLWPWGKLGLHPVQSTDPKPFRWVLAMHRLKNWGCAYPVVTRMSRGTSAPSAAYQKIKARGFIFFPDRYVIANRSNWEPPYFLLLNVHDRQFFKYLWKLWSFCKKLPAKTVIFALEKGACPSR